MVRRVVDRYDLVLTAVAVVVLWTRGDSLRFAVLSVFLYGTVLTRVMIRHHNRSIGAAYDLGRRSEVRRLDATVGNVRTFIRRRA